MVALSIEYITTEEPIRYEKREDKRTLICGRSPGGFIWDDDTGLIDFNSHNVEIEEFPIPERARLTTEEGRILLEVSLDTPREPSPRMLRAVENYRRIMSEEVIT